MPADVKIFSGRASRYLAERIAGSFGQPLGDINIQTFKDGEFQPNILESVRGSYVFFTQSTFAPSDNLMELLMMIDAAKRASAAKIIAVLPYYGYARQDRKDRPRVAIGAKLVAKMLAAAGAKRIMTMDLHADQIQGFFSFPIDHMFASSVFLPYLEKQNIPNLTIVAPDTGATKRANNYAKFLNADLAICYKQRKVANEVSEMTLIGEVKGRNVIIMDDMIDTAGTMCKAAEMIHERGALSVSAMCSHGVLSGPAYERIADSVLKELIITDSIPLKEGKDTSKIKVLSVSKLFADVITRVEKHESISTHFVQ